MIRGAMLRALLCIAVAAALGGCASMPFFGSRDAKVRRSRRPSRRSRCTSSRWSRPSRSTSCSRPTSTSARFRKAPRSDAVTVAELDRLAARRRRKARALLETEGYFNASVDERAQHRRERHAARAAGRVARAAARLVRDVSARGRTAPLADAAQGRRRGGRRSAGGDAELLAAQARSGRSGRRPGTMRRARHWRSCAPRAIRPATVAAHRRARSTRRPIRATLDLVDRQRTAVPPGRDQASKGIERYDADAVRRLATFSAGTPYREKLLLDYQERLVKAGLVRRRHRSTVDPDPANAGAAAVTVESHRADVAAGDRSGSATARTPGRASRSSTTTRPRLRNALDRAQASSSSARS
jgi:translocation and assembly module TamA